MREKENQTVRIADLTPEIVIILVFGLVMTLFGLLGTRIQTGDLPYNQNGAYGLVLVLISLQIITLGKTPFGTHRRSGIVVVLGLSIAVLGTIACLIPGFIELFFRVLVGVIMTAGGIILILQLACIRAGTWIRTPGILRHLIAACSLVYLMEILFGLISLTPSIRPGLVTTVLGIPFGISLFYLAWTLTHISRSYPRKTSLSSPGSSCHPPGDDRFFLLRDAPLPTPVAVILLLGVIFILFSLLLIPVSQGIIPFSRDSQFGLLMVIMAFQVLVLGKTPLGMYERSFPLILIGLVIVSIGIYSCIIPGLITGWILIPLGIWNIITGGAGLSRLMLPLLRRSGRHPETLHPLPKNLLLTVTLLHLVTIFFGINLLNPGIIPGIAVLAILFFLGLLFLLLGYILLNLPSSRRTDRID